MTVGRIEKLFMSQRRWDGGEVGQHCLDANERKRVFEKQQFVLQFYLGFLKLDPSSREYQFTHWGQKITAPTFEGGGELLDVLWRIHLQLLWMNSIF